MGAGIVRVARPTESGTVPVLPTVAATASAGDAPVTSVAPASPADNPSVTPVEPTPSAGSATVTTVRTASQAMRRAVSGWIGPTPLKTAGSAPAWRSVSALTVTVR